MHLRIAIKNTLNMFFKIHFTSVVNAAIRTISIFFKKRFEIEENPK